MQALAAATWPVISKSRKKKKKKLECHSATFHHDSERVQIFYFFGLFILFRGQSLRLDLTNRPS